MTFIIEQMNKLNKDGGTENYEVFSMDKVIKT